MIIIYKNKIKKIFLPCFFVLLYRLLNILKQSYIIIIIIIINNNNNVNQGFDFSIALTLDLTFQLICGEKKYFNNCIKHKSAAAVLIDYN